MPRPRPTAEEKAEQAAEQLRTLIREAHEAAQELRAFQRGIDVRVCSLDAAVDTVIGNAVDKGLDAYKASLGRAVTDATEAVYRRFDTIASLLLEGDPKAPSHETFEELIRRHLKARCVCGAYGRVFNGTDTPIPHKLDCPVKRIVGGA